MINIGEYLFNPQHIISIKLLQLNDDKKTYLTVTLTNKKNIEFVFPTRAKADSVFNLIQRVTEK